MNWIIYLAEVSAIVLILQLPYSLWLRKTSFHSLNRAYLLGIPLIAIVLPLLQFGTIAPLAGIPIIQLNEIIVGNQARVKGAHSIISLAWIPLALYLFGAAFMLGRFSLRLIKLGRMISQTQNTTIDGESVRLGKYPQPFSFFGTIVLPAALQAEEQFTVLKHEKAHVQLRHSFDIILVEILVAFLWFHPSTYRIRRELRDVHEYQADSAVAKQSSYDLSTYSHLMARLALSDDALSLSNQFSKTQIKRRLIMLSRKKSNRLSAGRYLLLLPLLGMSVFLFSCQENTREVEEENEETVQNAEMDKVYEQVDVMPEYPGGMQAMQQYLISELSYPDEVKDAGVEGKVMVQFVIDENGEVSDVTKLSGFNDACDEEAMRVVSNMPDWQPGQQDGQNVKVAMVLPISFKMN